MKQNDRLKKKLRVLSFFMRVLKNYLKLKKLEFFFLLFFFSFTDKTKIFWKKIFYLFKIYIYNIKKVKK